MKYSVLIIPFFLWTSLGTAETYSEDCHGGTFTSDEGIIQSPLYPKDYPTDIFCNWTISVGEGFVVFLKFYKPFGFDPKFDDDFLEVYDVLPNGERRLIVKLCYDDFPDDIISTTSKVDLELTTSGSNYLYLAYPGFKVKWKKIEKKCHRIIKDEKGSLKSPNHPSPYEENLNCQWEIVAPEFESVVLKFEQFDLGSRDDESCSRDRIEVFDVFYNNSMKKRGTYCGQNTPGIITSFGSKLILEFHTDNDNSNNGNGFIATWKNVSSCGGTFTPSDESGYLHPPNYHLDYFGSEDRFCNWTISAEERQLVKLFFLSPFRVNCPDSSVKVFDVYRNGTRNLRATLCGINPPNLLSLTSTMEVEFKYQPRSTTENFAAQWKTYPHSCYEIQKGDHGEIKFSSSNLSSDDDGDEFICRWDIVTSSHSNIEIRFEYFEFAEGVTQTCDHHRLKVPIFFIVEFFPNNTAFRIGKWCDSKIPRLIKLNGHNAKIKFFADSKDGHRFLAKWKAVSECGVHFGPEIYTGVFHSTDYPVRYTSPQSCKWTIDVAKGYKVKLDFNKHLDFSYDKTCESGNLTIVGDAKYIDHEHHTRIKTFCGTKVPDPMEFTSNIQVILSKMDGFASHGIFASWVKEDIDECAYFADETLSCDQKCTNTVGSWKCSCFPGYTPNGTKCIDPCVFDLCNHGVCEPKGLGYTCNCGSGWSGENCDVDEDGNKGKVVTAVIVSVVVIVLCIGVAVAVTCVIRRKRNSMNIWSTLKEDEELEDSHASRRDAYNLDSENQTMDGSNSLHVVYNPQYRRREPEPVMVFDNKAQELRTSNATGFDE